VVGPILQLGLELVLVLVLVPLMPYDSFPRYKLCSFFLYKTIL
jgi:hypothetical protein